MKKNVFFKLILLIFMLPIVCLLGTTLWLYTTYDVAKLYTTYPTYNTSKKDYEFLTKKPKSWASLNEISHQAKWAIVVSEDWAFYQHQGIDFLQLSKALEESFKEKEFVRGASTISQQVVKNVFLSQDRTLWRKFKELILTLKLERVVKKDKILEVYLNIVELGKDLYGIKNASSYYFNLNPNSLSAREGAFLAMLLPSPVKYSVSYRNKELSEFATHQINSILLKLRQAKIIDEDQRQTALLQKFSWEKKDLNEEYFEPTEEVNENYYDFNVYSEDGVNIHTQQ